MKLIKQSYEIIPQAPGLEGIYKQIEKAGRTCYKSEDKITEDSAKKFVERMINSKHTAMLEHGTLYFNIPVNIDEAVNFIDEVSIWTKCKLVESEKGNWWAITTNFRVMIEHFAPEYIKDLIEKYLCEPTEYHEKRVTVKFTTNQGILREFTRHRVFSFAVESTRYCNYNKSKHGNEITFIEPEWINSDKEILHSEAYDNAYEIFMSSCEEAEGYYMILIESGFKPEEARDLLPLCTKCDMIMTGFVSDWEHFFDLRALGTTGKPHPQAKELAEPLMEEFKTLNYI